MTTTPDQNPENSNAENPQSGEAQVDPAVANPAMPDPAPSAPLAPPVAPAQTVPAAPAAPAAPIAPAIPAAPATPAASVTPEEPATPAAPAVPSFLEEAQAPAAQPTTQFAPVPPAAQGQPVQHPVAPAHAPAQPAQQYAAPTHAPQQGFSDYSGQQPLGGDYSAPSAQATQPTAEYPAFQQAATTEAPVAAATSKSRTGVLLAGLAIGALLGGIVGGGVAAVVSSNSSNHSSSQASGTLTLNNPDSASTVSGVAAVATPSVVTLEVSGASASGSGSGVIYRKDGYIITNAHVVTLDGAAGDSAKIRVKLSDGRILTGKVVGVDPYADLAVVKVDADNLPAIKVADSTKLNVGDTTVAIGAPLNLSNTVTSGVVSAINRGISVGSPLIPQDGSDQQQQQPNDQGDQNGQGGQGTFPWDFRFGTPDDGQSDESQQQQQSTAGTVTLPVIQTDASINPGNSGGALLNADGELIGINVAIASTSSSSGTAGSVGLGFAIPSNLAVRVADALIDGKQPSHGLLGASVVDSSQDTDADQNFAGGLVVDVASQGAAEKAGLKAGDVITKVAGVPAVDGTSVSALIRMNGGGSKVTIDYMRNGKAAQTEATLGTLEW
ncbi:PDZ domain-containing protein [Leucobacter viscericola]|uniref:PDZ domain-containing protein n=1 Tax=Leucobacter viscericola TaxID=2714935 RepID=A0A6G7XCB5_9MICO|nr:trypsin-like peptidase domain-containing protein [Leucobacter viscericola]QIK62250.1 PDZ domain-containing protein [Leucobacter viscericola]